MKKDKRYRQGIFNPVNSQKYIGKGKPTYRSGWELKFFRWADLNENILAWGSENIIIPYLNPLDGKVHRYFVDNYVVIKEGENIKKYLIEIKPPFGVVFLCISVFSFSVSNKCIKCVKNIITVFIGKVANII